MKIANFFKRTAAMSIAAILLMSVSAHASVKDIVFGDVFDAHGSVMLIIDVDSGQIVEANKTAIDYYGYSYEDLTSMAIQEINILSAEETKAERILAVSEERNYFNFEHKLASGEIRNVEVYSYPFEEDGSNLLYSIIHDVTEKTVLENALESRKRTMYWLGAIFIIIQTAIIIMLNRSLSENRRIQKELYESGEKYRSLFDNMQEGFALHEIITDSGGKPVDYKFLEINKAFMENTGLSDVRGKSVKEVLPDTEALWIEKYGKVAIEGIPIDFESYSKALDRHYKIFAYCPQKNRFASIFLDITDRIEMEKSLKEEKDRMRTTLMSVGDGVIVTDMKGTIEAINERAEKISGWSSVEAIGKNMREILKFKDEKDGNIEELMPIEKILEKKSTIEWKVGKRLVDRKGGSTSIALNASPIIDENGKLHGAVLVLRDTAEESKWRKEIEFISYHDHLTGLYNRRFFETELERLDTRRNLPISVIYADVNGLKIINDAFGHEKGDILLKNAADVLRRICRADDIISRVGGDEFAVLLPATSSEMAEKLVGRIRDAIDGVKLETGKLSIAIGWETKTEENQSIEEMLRIAENRMYKRKISERPKIQSDVIKSVMETLYGKSEYERGHSQMVSFYCGEIGKALGMETGEIEELRKLGILHDIGMVGLDVETLNKHESLTNEEWEEIKSHPEVGRRILSSIGKYSKISDIEMAHHERWDGNGYPKGLRGKEIPYKARILALAEAYEAMTNKKCYKENLSREQALQEIRSNAGTQFDPQIAEVFIEYLEKNSGCEE